MKFYSLEMKLTEEKKFETQVEAGQQARACWRVSKALFEEGGEKTLLVLSEIKGKNVTAAVITIDDAFCAKEAKEVFPWSRFGLEVEEVTVREVLSRDLASNLENAYYNDFARRPHITTELFDMGKFFHSDDGVWASSSSYEEILLKPLTSRTQIRSEAKKILWDGSLGEEIARIYKGSKNAQVKGHPVHYLLAGDHLENREKATELLLSALWNNGRIRQRRYCELYVSRLDHDEMKQLMDIYRMYRGGTVVIRFSARARGERGVADVAMATIEKLVSCIRAFRDDVLTVLCFPLSCEREKELFFDHLPHMTFIPLCEGKCDRWQARRILVNYAKEAGYTDFAGLTQVIEKDKTYTVGELERAFGKWSAKHIKEEAYPQYCAVSEVEERIVKEKPQGCAFDRLRDMIGLSEAKAVITNAINYNKMRRIAERRGERRDRAAMHMVFTGAPGTAKTTAARLFAQIMRDNKLLSSGHLVEVGRGDLVGKYVGWTAQLVKKKFKEARGGVLFIDEAYSLVDDKEGMYGDEAINTIVQEMENNRDDLVVIFAGYSDKMEEFLARNPGLRSRIAFHVPFADYTPDELLQITHHMAGEKHLALANGVDEKLLPLYRDAGRNPDFGNGRYVRNMLEKATMRQASRLLASNDGSFTDDALRTLVAEDFEADPVGTSAVRKIGFAV